MYEVSTAYKNYIENNLERDYKVKLTVGTDVIDSNDIFSYSIETNQPSDKYTIGNAISKMLKIEIKNQAKPFYNNQLFLEIGMLVNGAYEYVPIGYFNVDKSEKKDHRTIITAYDNMYKLEGLYVCNLSTKTIKDILDDIELKTGIQMPYNNYNNYTITEDIIGYSYREVVAMMAGLNGGNAYIDREGKIKFVYLSSNASKWSINDFYLFDGNSFKEQSYTIDKVTCYKDKDTSWSNGNLGTTAMTIEYENPFMTESIARDIYNRLANIVYQAFSMETISYVALDVGDWISYTSQNNTVYSLCIQHYKFSGGIKQTLEAKTDGNKSNFNASGSLTQKVNRTITDLLAAKKAIIGKANIDDLVAGKITVSTLNGGTATLQEIMTSFITGSAGQFLHLTGQNVVIDEAVIRNLIASKITADMLTALTINTDAINILAEKDGYKLILKGRIIQFIDTNGDTPVIVGQIGFDTSNNFTFAIKNGDGYTVYGKDGITEHAVPDGLIINSMVADNANISGYKLNIDSVINEINNNGTETFKSSVVKLDDTGQTLDVAFKELSTTVDNFDADNKNLAFYNTDYWEQGGINNSGETFESNQYLRTNNYINLSPGKYTITKYSSDFNIQLYLYEESTFKKVIAPGTFELLNNSSVKLVVCKEPISKIELSELVLFKFKLESGEVSTEFSYNPVDVGYLTHALQTEVNVQQGEIDQLVKDTKIIEGGNEKKLKDKVNEINSTVEGTTQKVSSMETKVSGIGGVNLIRGTSNQWSDWWTFNNTSGSNVLKYIGTMYKENLKLGDKVTISFLVEFKELSYLADAENLTLRNVTKADVTEWSNQGRVDCSDIKLNKVSSGSYFFNYTVELTEERIRNDSWKFYIRLDGATSGSIRWRYLIAQKGEEATAWTPSPYDYTELTTRVSSCEVKTTDEAFSVQVQKNQNKQYAIRYIRDYIAGSNESTNNHWTEIQVINNIGENIALNKSVTCSNANAQNLSKVVDGEMFFSYFAYSDHSANTLDYVQIDLGGVYRNVDEIKIWHKGWETNRIYNQTKTQISEDGVHWITLFDSDVSGTYQESQFGHSVKVNASSFNSSQVTINENGLEVRNGRIAISDASGHKNFYANEAGDLTLCGTFQQFGWNGKKSIEISDNQLKVYDWELSGDFVGGVASTRAEGVHPGRFEVYGDSGNPLCFGIANEADMDGSSTIKTYMSISDNDEYIYPINFHKEISLLNYNGINLATDSKGTSVMGTVSVSSTDNLFVMCNTDANKKVYIGGRSGNSYTGWLEVNSGGITAYGNIACTGTKLRAVKTKNFGIVGQNAYETAEPYFGDLMFAKTSEDCYCIIPFDDKFLETVNTKCRYHVMCSAYGNNDDVFPILKCVEQTENYFIIKSNVPNIEFSVEVKCRQVGYEADRLEVQDIKINNQESDYSELENNYKNTQNDTIYLDKIYNDDFLE